MIANGIADSFINTALQRRYEASAYARNFLDRQINKTRGDLERSERSLVAYAQAQGIINTGSTATDGTSANNDVGSLQGESLVKLNEALADATARRVAAEGAYRQARPPGRRLRWRRAPGAASAACQLEAEYQQKREFMKPEHPEMQSLRAQIAELDRQIARASRSDRFGPQQYLARRLSGAHVGRARASGAGIRAQGRRSQPSRPKHSV